MSESLSSLFRTASIIATTLTENGGEISEELSIEMENNNYSLTAKADSYGFILQALEMQAQVATDRRDEWNKFLSVTENAISNLKTRMKIGLEVMQLTEICGRQSTFRIQANPPSCIVDDLAKLPSEFMLIETPQPIIKIDKRGITEAIKAGRVVPGAHLERTTKVVHKIGLPKVSGK